MNVITMLEANVPQERLAEVKGVFASGMADLPPEIVESFLVQDMNDRTLFRLVTVWRTLEDLLEMRKSVAKPKGVQMFEAVGAKPKLMICDVVVRASHEP